MVKACMIHTFKELNQNGHSILMPCSSKESPFWKGKSLLGNESDSSLNSLEKWHIYAHDLMLFLLFGY
jgi:hypothetical protein